MKKPYWPVLVLALGAAVAPGAAAETPVYETTSPYHHIRIVDEEGIRVLYFDSAPQSRMSLDDPLRGHFEYIEYLHLPWLWKADIRSVLVIGLGGGSLPRTILARHPGVVVETVELDPAVIDCARMFFGLRESDRMSVVAADGRLFLRRSTKSYDLIVLDAYTANRYGSGIPYALVTREFFQLVRERLTDSGIFACNVIGSVEAGRSRIVAAIAKTVQTAFPSISLFPVEDSGTVVMIAPVAAGKPTLTELLRRAAQLEGSGATAAPEYRKRVGNLLTTSLDGIADALVLTDDFAPVDGLLKTSPAGATLNRQEIEELRKTLTLPDGATP